MSTHHAGHLSQCLVSLCLARVHCLYPAWSDSDKTVVDLERGRPEAASRYHRPRAAHLYQYDKTEVDLAVPLPPQPAEGQRGSQRPATLPPQAPRPWGRTLKFIRRAAMACKYTLPQTRPARMHASKTWALARRHDAWAFFNVSFILPERNPARSSVT